MYDWMNGILPFFLLFVGLSFNKLCTFTAVLYQLSNSEKFSAPKCHIRIQQSISRCVLLHFRVVLPFVLVSVSYCILLFLRIIEFVSSFTLSLFLIIFLTLVQNRLDNLLLCKSNSMDAFLSYVHCFLVPGRGLCSSAPPRRL
jgi:hypothetical protein